MNNKVVFHSSHCPRCQVLERKLKDKAIEYEENNDIQVMLNKGLDVAPALEVDGKLMGFKEAVDWINNYGE